MSKESFPIRERVYEHGEWDLVPVLLHCGEFTESLLDAFVPPCVWGSGGEGNDASFPCSCGRLIAIVMNSLTASEWLDFLASCELEKIVLKKL